jgi:hypothetical protein
MKYFALISIVTVCFTQAVSANSFADGKRYICNITSAAGWTNENDLDQFTMMKPERQYIIEPTDQVFMVPREAAEGFAEKKASHSIKILGESEQAAVCGPTFSEDLVHCWRETSFYKDADGATVDDAVFPAPWYTFYKVDNKIYLTHERVLYDLYTHRVGYITGFPSVEAGVCSEF